MSSASAPYLRCICICDFDVDVGQVTRVCFPADALARPELCKVACLALPDSNTHLAEIVYTFRLRCDSIPFSAASATSHSYMFGCSYFRQQRDQTVRRGIKQQSLVVLGDAPFIGLMKHMVRIMGPQYFELEDASPAAAATLLEVAYLEVSRWPPPVPGMHMELPLLGEMIRFDVPWVGLHSYRGPHTASNVPQAADDGEGEAWRHALREADGDTANREEDSAAAAAAAEHNILEESGAAAVTAAEGGVSGRIGVSSSGGSRRLSAASAGFSEEAPSAGALVHGLHGEGEDAEGSSRTLGSAFAAPHEHHQPHSCDYLQRGAANGQRGAANGAAFDSGDYCLPGSSGAAPAELSASDSQVSLDEYNAKQPGEHRTLQQATAATGGNSASSFSLRGNGRSDLAAVAGRLEFAGASSLLELGGSQGTVGAAGARSPPSIARHRLHLQGHYDPLTQRRSPPSQFATEHAPAAPGFGPLPPGTASLPVRALPDPGIASYRISVGGVSAVAATSSSAAVMNSGGGGLATSRPLTLREMFAASARELPGLFQEIGLFSVFRSLSPCLWHMWELAITGQPILVMGSSPDLCGDAVLAIVSLISPLEYNCDWRPYITLFDPDFHAITAMVDAQWGRANTRLPRLPQQRLGGGGSGAPGAPASSTPATGEAAGGPAASSEEEAREDRQQHPHPRHRAGHGDQRPHPSQAGQRSSSAAPAPAAAESPRVQSFAHLPTPPVLIGTTNPFFLKALERWPNAVWLGSKPSAAHGSSGINSAGRGSSTPTPAHGSSTPAGGGDTGRVSAGDPPHPPQAAAPGRGSAGMRRSSLSASSDLFSAGAGEPASPSNGQRRPGPSGGSIFPLARGYSVADAKPRIVSASASLSDLLPGPGQEAATEATFISRCAAILPPDAFVLSQLLRVRASDEEGRQLRLGGARGGPGTPGALAAASAARGRAPSAASVPGLPQPTASGRGLPQSPDGGRGALSPGGALGATSRSSAGGAATAPGHYSPGGGTRVRGSGSSTPTHGGDRASWAGGGELHGAAGWSWDDGRGLARGDIPAVVINNAILRQHFRSLTFSFLRPFERYFRLDARASAQVSAAAAEAAAAAVAGGGAVSRGGGAVAVGAGQPHGSAPPPASSALRASLAAAPPPQSSGYFGPYDDLAASFLPRFEEGTFLAELERAGGPRNKLLAGCKWRALYSAFIRSPHFHPWFHARRRECLRTLFLLSRTLRMSVSLRELLREIMAIGAASGEGDPAARALEAAATAAAAAAAEEPAQRRRRAGGALGALGGELEHDDAELPAAAAPPYAPPGGSNGTAVAANSSLLEAASAPSLPSAATAQMSTSNSRLPATPLLLSSNGVLSSSYRSSPSAIVGPSHPDAAPATAGGSGPTPALHGAPQHGTPYSSAGSPAAAGSAASGNPPNPGPLTRVVGRGLPHTVAITHGLASRSRVGSPVLTTAPASGSSSHNGATPLPLQLDAATGGILHARGDGAFRTSPASATGGTAVASGGATARGTTPASPAHGSALSEAAAVEAFSVSAVPWVAPAAPAPAKSPPAALASASSRRAAELLRSKIAACFSRDAAFLAEDPELARVMRAHLAAVEVVAAQPPA